MKKIYMWYIKLAFAALFFLAIAEIFTMTDMLGTSTPSWVPIVEAANQAQQKQIETVALTDAVLAATTAEKIPTRLQAPTKLVTVRGKAYSYNLVIPALKVNVGVLSMGLTPEGKMAVPDNYKEVGWYNLGSKPGETGSAVMGAHVDNGRKINGVFKNLKNLKVGENIYVSDGDGNIYHYKVTVRKVYNYKTPITNEVFLQKDTERLNLITCYGTWLPKENTYDRRLVVYAELVRSTKLSQR